MNDARYWRIRIKYGRYEDLTSVAWEDEVGIWYGAWGTDEFEASLKSDDPLALLSKVNREHGLNWKVPDSFLNTALTAAPTIRATADSECPKRQRTANRMATSVSFSRFIVKYGFSPDFRLLSELAS